MLQCSVEPFVSPLQHPPCLCEVVDCHGDEGDEGDASPEVEVACLGRVGGHLEEVEAVEEGKDNVLQGRKGRERGEEGGGESWPT